MRIEATVRLLTLFIALMSLVTTVSALPTSNAVVFMYHHFGESSLPTTNVSLAQFDAHLDHLAENGYQIWSLEKIAEHLKTARPIPDRTIAITVDDAYISVYTRAYPRMKKRGWPFTVFVSTDAVDNRLPAFMSWDQMREMQLHGVTFANHSSSHDSLLYPLQGESREAWSRRIRADIERAQNRLQAELGQAPLLFAYPYGEYTGSVAAIVQGLGYTAFGQQSGAIGPYSDPRALPRYPMASAYADIDSFRVKAASLALPVSEVKPWDPLFTGDSPPEMEMTLADSDARLDQLVCYISGNQRTGIRRDENLANRFYARANQPLPPGRSRYNCTAPSATGGRYYWYSHLWIRQSPAN